MTITTSPIIDGFYNGLSLTFTGMAEFHPNVDSPLHISGTWSKTNPFLNLRTDTRVRLNDPHLVVNGSGAMVYVSSLTLNGLDTERGDSGDYTLSLDISSHSHTVGTRSSSTHSITVLRKEKSFLVAQL